MQVGAIALGALAVVGLTSINLERGVLNAVGWRYLQGVGLTILIFALLALGLNIQFGFTGLLNFGHVASMAIGTYTAALFARHFDTYANPLWAIPILVTAALLAALWAFIMGAPTLRLRQDYLAIVTIGAAEILRTALLNEPQWTNGPNGLSVRAPGSDHILTGAWPEFIAALPVRLDPYYTALGALALALGAGCYWVAHRLENSPWGLVAKAIREDDEVASSLGKDVFRVKTESLIVGSIIAAFAGVLWAWYQRFIAPDNFLPIVTFYAWIALVVGGLGSNKGVLAGSAILWGIFESARQLPGQVGTGPLQVVVIGVALVVIMMVRPQGIMGKREELLYAR